MYRRRSVDPQSPDPEPSHGIVSNSERSPLLPWPGSEDRSTAAANERGPAKEPRNSHHPFTRRALCLSLVLGAAGSAMNTFFGLRTGSVTGYAIPFAFIAKAAFGSSPLTDAESAVVVTVAVTMATMPMVAASLGVVPALQFLAGPREGGPVVLTAVRHLAWTQAIAYFPLFYAMLLRDRFLDQADLPFPSATAAAMTIDDKATATAGQAALPRTSSTRPMAGSDTAASEELLDRSEHVPESRGRPQENPQVSRVTAFLIPVALSGFYTLVTRLIPGADMVHCIPLWATGCWSLDLSPGMIGLGMIAGPQIAYDLFVSTLFGWGFLAWLCRARGWVSAGRGTTGDWERGVRSWIIWPGLAALLADCLVNVIGSLVEAVRTSFSIFGDKRKGDQGADHEGTDDSEDESQEAVLERRSSFGKQVVERTMMAVTSPKAIGIGLAVVTLLCPFLVNFVFANMLTWVEIFCAFVIALPLSYMAIQATGRTDTTPASALAKVSQIVFALFADLDHYSHAFLINLVAGAIAEAGAVQAADLLLYQKLGRLLNVSGNVVFVAQILGSAFGGVAAVFWYWFFTTARGGRIPNGGTEDEGLLGGLPAAHIWYATAKQALKRGLPRSASIAAAVTGGCFLLFATAKFCSARQWGWTFTRIRCPGTVRFESFSARWARWVPRVVVDDYVERDWLALFPAGSSFAAAMNNSPHVTVAWSLGGLVYPILSSRGLETMEILLIGSGLVLGEGMAEIAATLVEHWSPLGGKHETCSMQC